MVGKRRPHKNRPTYKKVVGTGTVSALEINDEIDEELPPYLADKLSVSTSDSLDPSSFDEDNEVSGARDFPLEIIDLICSLCETKFNLLLVNKRWYLMALPHVYAYPKLTPAKFPFFVEVLTKYRDLGGMVRELDLAKIAQVGKNSMVSRLLRRCSPKLEFFCAPQSHFGYAPMISLASCSRMKVLNLGLVSETLDLPQLFKIIQNFHDLEVLYFPRSSIRCEDEAVLQWPPNLRQLGLSGGFPPLFLETTEFPQSLKELHISNCPYMTSEALNSLLNKIGKQLKYLSLAYPVPNLTQNSMDFVFLQCPNLLTLQVSIDYISRDALDEDIIPKGHPLRNLFIMSSGLMGHADKIKPGDVLLSTESLTHLRRVSVSLLLGWDPKSVTLLGLVDTLTERGGGVWMK